MRGLVRLEQESSDEDLLQAIFRAAHTLKGAAGMIGHKRMVEVTHVLETALDDLRKQQIVADASMIDLCLESVDAIRALSGEVAIGQASEVSIQNIDLERLATVLHRQRFPGRQPPNHRHRRPTRPGFHQNRRNPSDARDTGRYFTKQCELRPQEHCKSCWP